ncbi:hypothetical protein E2C01_078761 [Portunus trituberculatus]|uniref:Uncharacterized protein n=1 Tax=Portunus trituberculatus TaxID=210409 RepID=A0A5B7IR07_PORTR|nr:hypothetical protein [Portunus trituberculatus]
MSPQLKNSSVGLFYRTRFSLGSFLPRILFSLLPPSSSFLRVVFGVALQVLCISVTAAGRREP